MTDTQAKAIALERVQKMQPKLKATWTFESLNYNPEAAFARQPPYNDHAIVWEENGQWFHTDETWTDKVGPFDSQESAQASFDEYCRTVLGR